MAITAKDYLRVLGPSHGARQMPKAITRATSVAFKVGDPVAVASGAGANASASHVVAATLCGFAARKETASSGTGLQIMEARQGTRIMGKINTASSSSKLLQKHLYARAGIKRYTSSSVNVWTVDPNLSSSSGKFQLAVITDLVDAVSTVNGRVIFEIASELKNATGYSLF